MKLLKKYTPILILTIASLLSACNDEQGPFLGTDNYIVSFTLKQGEVTYNAAIANNKITIIIPEGVSLKNAEATITLSENASIYPDPKSITEWDNEMIFAVTAYNEEQIRYTYTVARNSINTAGTVTLETQADVDAFGREGYTSVAGNLVIGRTVGKDSITSLAPLSQLREIGYSLIVNPTLSAIELTGFDKLEKVGGEIRLDGAKNAEKVNFPALKSAGSIYIKNGVIGIVEFPELTSVSKTITLDCPLADMRFPNLKTVEESITLNTANNSNAMLAKISFPSLEKTGDIYFTYFKSAKKVELPELRQVRNMNFNQLTTISYINAPKLEISTGTITIPATQYLSEVSFPELIQANTLSITGKAVQTLEFPKLKTITDKLTIQNAQVDGIKDFKALERVEGEVTLYDLPLMTSLDLPSSLQYIGRLSIDRRNTSVIDEINIKGKNIGELKIMANAIKSKIVGDDIFKGTLTIASSGASYVDGAYPEFPILEGFKEVDSLSLDGYVSNMNVVNIHGIKKINKGFRIENNNMQQFSMPDLEEIGGNFYFARLDRGIDNILEFTKLKTINGSFDLSVGSTTIRTLSFPALESVNGDFRLGTGYNADRSLETVLFPTLHTISGNMLLHGYSGTNTNRLLTNLDGFSALNSVQSIEITNQMAIESFEGLREAIKSITPEGWKATGNNYNPTFEDLQADKWTKP